MRSWKQVVLLYCVSDKMTVPHLPMSTSPLSKPSAINVSVCAAGFASGSAQSILIWHCWPSSFSLSLSTTQPGGTGAESGIHNLQWLSHGHLNQAREQSGCSTFPCHRKISHCIHSQRGSITPVHPPFQTMCQRTPTWCYMLGCYRGC